MNSARFLSLLFLPLAIVAIISSQPALAQQSAGLSVFDATLKAANRGDPFAQFELGEIYYNGQGVPKDYAEAARWYLKVANQGLVDAQYKLGVMYYSGKGVPKDFAEAARWYKLAANQGDTYSQAALGAMYYNGNGPIKDFVQAYMWISVATSNFSENNKIRESLEKQMIPHQIAHAKDLSRKCAAQGKKNCSALK